MNIDSDNKLETQIPNEIDILLVDDSIAILSRIKEMLQDIPCISNITTATNAFDAYYIIKTNSKVNLVLLDINMPGKNGVELLREIKLSHPHIKVMMVTNQPVDYYKPVCKALGAEFYIDKSTEFEKIGDIIESLCSNPTI